MKVHPVTKTKTDLLMYLSEIFSFFWDALYLYLRKCQRKLHETDKETPLQSRERNPSFFSVKTTLKRHFALPNYIVLCTCVKAKLSLILNKVLICLRFCLLLFMTCGFSVVSIKSERICLCMCSCACAKDPFQVLSKLFTCDEIQPKIDRVINVQHST